MIALERDAVIVACAVSAGIHAGLVPEHFADGAGAGLGFAASALALAGLVVALTRRPLGAVPVAGSAVVLTGLLAGYALATTSGLPLLHPEPEPVETLALFTKGVEALGLALCLDLLRRGRPLVALASPRPKGMLT